MKASARRFLSYCLTLVMMISFLPVFTTNADAASYPSIYPSVYTITVQQGETAELKFIIMPEYKNEHAYINVHKGSSTGPIVAKADRSFYNTSSSMFSWTVNWDTSNVEPGKYVVEYYMTFYTLYDWHEVPERKYLLTINVTEPPCPNGHKYDKGVVTTEPTCNSEGVKTFTCKNCSTTKTETVPALDHTSVTDPAVPPHLHHRWQEQGQPLL